MSIELKRHHRERLKKVRQQYWGNWDRKLTPREAGIILSAPAACNCWMCRKPRKTFKEKTVQEQRFEQTEKWA